MLDNRTTYARRIENVSQSRVRLETTNNAANADTDKTPPRRQKKTIEIPVGQESANTGAEAATPVFRNRDHDQPETTGKVLRMDDNTPAVEIPPASPIPSGSSPGVKRDENYLPNENRRETSQSRNRAMGHVISCNGSRVVIRAVADDTAEYESTQWGIGRLISINQSESRIVGLIYQLDSADHNWNADGENIIIVRAELQGEIFDGDGSANPAFRRGISSYPQVGAIAHRIRVNDLRAIYQNKSSRNAVIGTLSQDASVLATISVDEMISKHFAILGSTGTGKSSAASLVLHKIQESMPELRILILDPHNEYSCGFRETAEILDIDSFELPHWLFQLDEFCEVIFRGNPVVPEERDALRDLIPTAKILFMQHKECVGIRKAARMFNVTADTPMPYRISDLNAVIEEQIGQLDSTVNRSVLKSLKGRIDSLSHDPRFRFMFSSLMVTDNATETLGRIFRIPSAGRPISVLHMAEIPSEVVNSLVSVICRLAFDLTLSSNGRSKMLIVCEEAHRYIPEDKSLGFAPTRQAIARIAKEGRKYGVYLCIITQRPGELDPTILSQCSTVFALRLSNQADQDIVRGAISSSSRSTVSFLSSIGNREAIAFGEGISSPMRLRFSDLPAEWVLGRLNEQVHSGPHANDELEMIDVLNQWRNN